MGRLESDSPFEELRRHAVVVAYDSEDNGLGRVLSEAGVEYVEVDLGESERLRAGFMEHFGVSKLPALMIDGSVVADDPEKRAREYAEQKDKDVCERIQRAIDPQMITLFIKGSPEHPKCGFTRTLIDTLYGAGVTRDKIVHFDVLLDEAVRRKLKEINGWPTFPQVYIAGSFVGGLDVIRKMDAKGRLRDELRGVI